LAPEERAMGDTGRPKSVVVVELPGGREFIWLSPNAPMTAWQVGDAVVFRNRRWLVTRRVDESETLNLTLSEFS
jgi:hypothetical protein